MTGTASSKGKIFMDFDSYKNQEWLRRRKLRLEQVRKQSNEIARALRQKVSDEEKRRLAEYERMREEELRMWKAEKLEELERKLMCALEKFGASYRLAEEETNPELIIEEKNKVNILKAQERGEIARQEELRRNKLAKEQLMYSIERKKMTRKREDLRSALVRTIPNKKQMITMQEVCQETNHQPGRHKISLMKKKIKRHNEKCSAPAMQKKVPGKNVWKKKQVNHKSYGCTCQQKESEACPAEDVETMWINLDEMQNSSAGESGSYLRTSRSRVDRRRRSNEKEKGCVEYYDFSSRYYCKSFKELPHLVERISHDSEELNANDLAKAEEEMERLEARRKQEIDAVSQERGMEALRKEKINRDYNNLMTKLDELSKKEKILKAQQRNPPSFIHMSDERLSQRTKMKQRIMESKFESVYYEVTARIPQMGTLNSEPTSPTRNVSGGGDYLEAEEQPPTRLSFSASNLKHNTPATSSGQSSLEATPRGTARRPERTGNRRQLLKNISNALRQGRELRRRISRSWETNSSEGEDGKGLESSDFESEETKGSSGGEEASGGERKKILRKCQESQTEVGEESRLRISEKVDDSLPVSTSTSYKSPPSVIRNHNLDQVLDYFEGLSEAEEQQQQQQHLPGCSPKLKSKVNTILRDLLHEGDAGESKEKERKSSVCPSLEFYIEKLLNMSRECIANLSVSSENISTPNMTELDVRDDSEAELPEAECPSRLSSRGEDLVRKCRLERADTLENSIRNWKKILEKTSEHPRGEREDVPDCPQTELVEECDDEDKNAETGDVICSPKIKSRYDEITKKCSERISELSDMLDKVRKDKEKLLSSASGGSSLNLSKGERNSGKGFDVEEADEEEDEEDDEEDEEEVVPVRRSAGTPKTSPVLEGFINRYNLTRPREETVSTTAVVDSQSLQDLNESLESWPDVMDELLKKEILTSPFKWSDGESSSELTTVRTKPSSIESVIGNFRKEIDKIKPFSLTEPCSEVDSPSKPRWPTDGEYRKSCPSPEKRTSCVGSGTESEHAFREESSVESINHYLTSLGLNWAKSFLRKNAESRAMSSSSNSEKKSSGDEEEN